MSARPSSPWLFAFSSVLALALGCKAGDAGSEDGSFSPCVAGQFCPSGLTCIAGFCVPDSDGETSAPGDGDGDGDGDQTGDGDGDQTGDGDADGDGDGDQTGDGDGDGSPNLDFASGGPCDPWLQDCPPGQKCAAYANGGSNWNDNKCVPITGNGQSSQPCTSDGTSEGTDTCAAGLMCWNLNQNDMGTCAPLCTGTENAPMCPGTKVCLVSNDGSLNLCLDSCNPLTQNCGFGQGCYFQAGNFSCLPTTSNHPTGQTCGFLNDCAPGNICLGAASLANCAGSACCASFCNINSPSCPALNPECVSLFDGDAPAGYENVGVCMAP